MEKFAEQEERRRKADVQAAQTSRVQSFRSDAKFCAEIPP